MNRKKLDAILQDLIHEAPLNDLDLLGEDNSLRIEALTEALTSELANLSRESETSAPLMAELREAYPAEDFWDRAENRLEELLRPYQETAFLRDMGDAALERYMLDTFEGMIHYQEPWTYLSKHFGVDEEQLRVTYRVHNTLTQWVIEGRYSKRHFLHECEMFFQWPGALSEALWKLLDSSRAMLAERSLLKRVSIIEQTLKKTSSFLDGFDDSFDFDIDELDDDEDDPFTDDDSDSGEDLT